MASVIINGTTYNAVPYIKTPKSGGGMATYYDTSDATATDGSYVLSGFAAYGANGKINGSLTTPTITQDVGTGALTIS